MFRALLRKDDQMSKRILHIGVGNFFRAHMADYTQIEGTWSILGISLRSAATRDGLSKQSYDYTLRIQGLSLIHI